MSTRPNILILYTDQQRWDALGVNGNREIKTPNLDRLAQQGVNFDRYFVQNPVCMPSRISFLSGQYPSTLGITHMGVPVPEEIITLPKILRQSGYTTANVGKLHFLPHANRDHRMLHPQYGFDYLAISDEPGCYEDAYRAWVRQKAPEYLDHISPGLPPAAATWYRFMNVDDPVVHPEERFPKEAIPFRAPAELTHTAFVADKTIEFTRANQGRSWLCIAGFYSPHSPWVAPQEFLDLYDPDEFTLPQFPPELEKERSEAAFSDQELRAARHGYYAMVSEVDHHVGRILDHLKETGQEENTIVVLVSDHGEWLGEHLRYGKGYPGLDPVSRVPLVVRWPAGVKNPGRTESGITEAVDVVPTLLEAAGVQIVPEVQGRSFLSALVGGEYTGRESALMEQVDWKQIRTDRYRYVHHRTRGELLFDLESDPHEYRNVAEDASYTEVLAEMRRLLMIRVLENERPLPRVWAY